MPSNVAPLWAANKADAYYRGKIKRSVIKNCFAILPAFLPAALTFVLNLVKLHPKILSSIKIIVLWSICEEHIRKNRTRVFQFITLFLQFNSTQQAHIFTFTMKNKNKGGNEPTWWNTRVEPYCYCTYTLILHYCNLLNFTVWSITTRSPGMSQNQSPNVRSQCYARSSHWNHSICKVVPFQATL